MLGSILALLGMTAANSLLLGNRFTDESAARLQDLHTQLVGTAALEQKGYPVEDVHWTSEAFDLHLKSGAVFLEPPVDGEPVGAFFVGEAAVSFVPEEREARRDVEFWFSERGLRNEPVSEAYLFTLSDRSLVEQLGISGDASVPFASQDAYRRYKIALRQRGVRVTHAFLNRDGRGRGTSYVVLSPESIRTRRNDEALLLYSYDPNEDLPVQLEGLGHDQLWPNPDYRNFLRGIAATHSVAAGFTEQADVSLYSTTLDLSQKMTQAKLETTLTLTPEEGLSALLFDLTPALEVGSVRGPDGNELEFLQWKHDAEGINPDQRLLVDLGGRLPAGGESTLTVVASGQLLERGTRYLTNIDASGILPDIQGVSLADYLSLTHAGWRLADEDDWFPNVRTRGLSNHELIVTVGGRYEAVGTGRLVGVEKLGKGRQAVFRTSAPSRFATFYVGEFANKVGKADDTTIEVFVDRNRKDLTDNLQFTLTEVENAVRVFNRILDEPLELNELRVASTPTLHGRGFQGLLLLAEIGGFRSDISASDLFRAHEVAHQWWGNIVGIEEWPRDRWLMESTADYMAMEYYKIRFKDPGKTREQMYRHWVKDSLEATQVPVVNLLGETRNLPRSQIHPVIHGGPLVYTKGAWMLHSLRYLFTAAESSDAGFWLLLQDFVDEFKGKEAGTDDFIRMASERLRMDLSWFFDQWLYRTEIPTVRVTKEIVERDGKWEVTVRGTQDPPTEFQILIPVYVHLGGGRGMMRPLLVKAEPGETTLTLPEKPAKVTFNDDWEAIARIVE